MQAPIAPVGHKLPLATGLFAAATRAAQRMLPSLATPSESGAR